MIGETGGVTLRVRGLDGRERTFRVDHDASQPDIWNQKPAPQGWVALSRTLPGSEPAYLRRAGENFWFEHLPASRTLHVGVNTLRNGKEESMAAFAERLAAFIATNPVDRLVIDLRWNNGGDTALAAPLLAAVLRSERVNRRGCLYVIIGRRTFSAAQNFATLLERYTNATFVGEPTGSSPNFIGEDDPFILPYSKFKANVSHLEWQSGLPQDKRVWIAPLIYTPPTFKAHRANRDLALEAVLALPALNTQGQSGGVEATKP